jgi:hypothetical protein
VFIFAAIHWIFICAWYSNPDMPRPRKQNALEVRIGTILTVAARQIAEAVRADIANQLMHVMGSGAGRQVAAASTSSASAAAPATGGGKRGRRGALNEPTLTRVLDIVKGTPGLRSEQIQKQLPLAPKLVKAALAKLRAAKRVKTTGEKRAMTYAV